MQNSSELQNFEDELFDKTKNPTIKYNIDHSIEASVKYEFLIEIYGKEKVNTVVPDFQKLYDQSYFIEVQNKLQNLS